MDIRAEIILALLNSLNRGDSCSVDHRVAFAIKQYEQLVAAGVIKEADKLDEAL